MVKIVHIMADGTIRDDIEGAIIPLTPETFPAYKLFADVRSGRVLKETVIQTKKSDVNKE